jgi:hypothetical protein
MTTQSNYVIIITAAKEIPLLEPGDANRFIIIHSLSGTDQKIIAEDIHSAIYIISEQASQETTTKIWFISGEDRFGMKALNAVVRDIYTNTPDRHFNLLIPYKEPPCAIEEESDIPKYNQRMDGFVNSFMISPRYFDMAVCLQYFQNWARLAYELLSAYLNSPESNNIKIFQVGKKQEENQPITCDTHLLERSLMIIPHKDSLDLLTRCLHHLNQVEHLPGAINLCFDDNGYTQLNPGNFPNLKDRIKIHFNNPQNVGPYPPRHYSILNTSKDYIFFQDSDDIPVADRFVKQLAALQKRGVDMIGSHELRIDEFEKVLHIIRYPLDVSASLAAQCFHPLYHPTAIISKNAYLKTGGFSTNLRFGYDSQFLLRSHFFLKIENIDDFLYLRFKRPNSLTTDPKTSLGSTLRIFLIERWFTDFRLVLENKLNVEDSSLGVMKHQFDYTLSEYL